MKRLLVAALFLHLAGTAVEAQPQRLGSAYYHFSLAKLHDSNRDFESAVREFEKALELDPSSASLHTEFAKTLLKTGETSRATDECRKAIALDSDRADAHRVLGRIYFRARSEAGMLQNALIEFKRVLELEPNDEDALNYLGQIYFSLEDYSSALESFSRLVELDPASLRGFFFQAQALRQLDKAEEAIEVLEKGMQLRSDIPDYLILLAELYEEVGQLGKAADAYFRGYQHTRDPNLGRRLGRLWTDLGKEEDAVALYEKLLEAEPGNIQLQVGLGRALRVGRQYERAREVLEAALKRAPQELEANFESALVLRRLGLRQESIERFEYLLSITGEVPARDLFQRELAQTYQEERRFEEATEILRAILVRNPKDLDAGIRLVYALQQASQTEEALDRAKSLRKAFPESPFAVIALSRILAATDQVEQAVNLLKEELRGGVDPELYFIEMGNLYLEQEHFERALKVVQEGLDSEGESFRLRFFLGSILERSGDYSAAEREFQLLLKERPDSADVLNYLGYMLADRDLRLEEALGYIQRAVEMDPHNGAYLDSLGWAYFKLDRLTDAEVHLKRAIQVNSFDPVILEHLGDLYVRLGDAQAAVQYYEKSITFAEAKDEAERVRQKLSELSAAQKK